jgi:hypothetical protein
MIAPSIYGTPVKDIYRWFSLNFYRSRVRWRTFATTSLVSLALSQALLRQNHATLAAQEEAKSLETLLGTDHAP